MRTVLATLMLALPLAAAIHPAAAQPAPAPPPSRGVITRDQFIQRAMQMAGHRFDAIDTGHSGVITRDQLRAWRQAHQGQGQGRALPE